MKPKYFLLLLTLTIIHQTSSIATIRYVSKTGTSTPPYTSWQTSADSIQKCINICGFRDTVYVANGVYKEQIVMIPGLSLIGAGTDSCIIDTRDFATAGDFRTVEVKDSSLLKGFYVLCTTLSDYGSGIYCEGENSLITLNKVSSSNSGIVLFGELKSVVFNNQCIDNRIGINIFNAHLSIVKKNFIRTQSIEPMGAGITIGAFNSNYSPIIDSNIIEINRFGIDGIAKDFGSSPIITNNIILLNYGRSGIALNISNSTKIYNNRIIVGSASMGIENFGVSNLKLYNNYIFGRVGTGISVGGSPNDVKNNVVIGAIKGIEKWGSQPNPLIQYNNVWQCDISYEGFTPDTTNLSVNPMIVNDDTTQGDLDFHLQNYSPLIDAGDPNILDKDGSRSDIGLYGGMFGEIYNYLDLPPRTPLNLIAEVDTFNIRLRWNRNTEADTAFYKVYRDTVIGYQIDSTKLISSITDTFFVQTNPHKKSKVVYKITCVDKQGNESLPSVEVVVDLTSVSADDYPMTINDYILYQNYPNPFNPLTKIAYRLKESGYVKLYVYDIKGELISTLVNQSQSAGFYEVEFSSSSIQHQESGIKDLATGVYIYQIMVKSEKNIPVYSDIKKMIYLK
jgi:hypothetical protein